MIKNNDKYLTSMEVSKILGISPDYVRKLITTGKIKAEKLGHNWIVNKKNINKIHRQRFSRKEIEKDGRHK